MGYSTCPEISLGEWGQTLMTQLGGQPYPLGATFEITERCNLNCVHCYINQQGGRISSNHQERSLDEIKRSFDQMGAAGVINLLLTGGEVFLRPDFFDIYQHAKQIGMLVMIFTNGTLINERIADYLLKWPPYFIEISTYGHTRNTYERVTGVPGSFDRYRRGIQLIHDRGLSLGLKTVVMTLNRNELHQMMSFANNLNVPFRYDGMIWPRLDGGKEPLKYRLSPEEVVALDSEDQQRQNNFLKMHIETKSQNLRSELIYACGAGYYGFHINASGKMSMCMMARQPSFDLKQGSIEEGWDFLKILRQKKRELDTPCQRCQVGILCTQCPGWSQMVHGDDETLVDYVCEMGHLRLDHITSLKNH